MLSFPYVYSKQKKTETSTLLISLIVLSSKHFHLEIIVTINNVQIVRIPIDTGQQTMPPLIDGMIYSKRYQQTMTN